MTPDENDELFNFPCEFPIKVMGFAELGFDALVIEIVQRHCQHELHKEAISLRTSSGGKYMAVTVTFTAHSREQLDALYQELTGHQKITMVL
ncbi:hypothetical protein BegalDRAFT_0223 [Beggiatoa alba B18LD]|uniref:UPF0250 protein BegalDRAFT_0223 n=1 Tax=Beggiatoa alba B18LD TaxID=395493 RepID=I3CC02_9GAMM|nr:DUF493 domain-containing protein [Beggiatoa alba]EIJ41145.1 hypothetical protein BegalDRAFT_0223 [Beggiatoa alba B18LD]